MTERDVKLGSKKYVDLPAGICQCRDSTCAGCAQDRNIFTRCVQGANRFLLKLDEENPSMIVVCGWCAEEKLDTGLFMDHDEHLRREF